MLVDEETSCEDFKGLRLIHLLMAAAEALTGVNKSRDLARVILVRLKELVSPNDGTNMERLAAYFTDALQGWSTNPTPEDHGVIKRWQRQKSIGTVQETGRRLVAFAASIGQPFSFHQCRLDSDRL
ncbi:hypothetical protein GH714_001031 [Hevea brasiliensis]|uniref:Uncharacterized protein n=1 Tax=Hevea brasiliensis TaxID=3981 RepID=A0A6A6L9G0_HEVBR|nr:hypothetical protein GH714_001031 [Hevea brasiliensis]